MDIIDEIIVARKQKGITQQKLSEMTGILQPVIARVEAKKSSPTIDFLYKILRALDLDLTLVKRNELKNNIIEFFNERAENWDKNPKSAEFLKKILQPVKINKGDKVLDLACGTGVISNILQEMSGNKLFAIDFSSEMIKIAKKKNTNPNIEFICTDFFDYNEKEFNEIVCFDAYPHFMDRLKFSKKLYDSLTKSGVAYIIHDCGREELNSHHKLHAMHVSSMLLPIEEEFEIFKNYFDILAYEESEHYYFIALRKK